MENKEKNSSTVKVIETEPVEKKKSEFEEDPFLENPLLRVFGFAGRVGRLFGTAFAKGSRYLAYTSDVGEAFRPVVDVRYIRAGYAVSWLYVLSDVGFQVKWAYEAKRDYVRAGCHAATFQVFGSMLLPAAIIHTVVHQSEKAFHKFGKQHLRWGPVGLGLAVVPFLPFIADRPVEYVVDEAFDRFWPSKDHDKSHHD